MTDEGFAPTHTLLHISDTHLTRSDLDAPLLSQVRPFEQFDRFASSVEASGLRVDAIVMSGDLANDGEADAYRSIRERVGRLADACEAETIWVMGNHDERSAFRAVLFADASGSTEPVDTVTEVKGLRIISLDTSVPGSNHGEVRVSQLEWLANVLREPAPAGTLIAMHHPPLHSPIDVLRQFGLRDTEGLAEVIRNTDVRSILVGHYHYSSFGMFAGVPVSVASSTSHTQDLRVQHPGMRVVNGAQAANLVHVYPDQVVHSVVPVAMHPVLQAEPSGDAAG